MKEDRRSATWAAVSGTGFSAVLRLAFAKADAGPATVLVDEFDASGFEWAPNDMEDRATRLTNLRVKLMNSYNTNASLAG
jgi:hypothetical protein